MLAARQVANSDTADEMLCQLRGGHRLEPRSKQWSAEQSNFVRRNAPIEHPAARFRIDECLHQQIVQIQDLDTALAHLQHEVVVILLRFLHPQHVVERSEEHTSELQSLAYLVCR